MPKKSDQSSKNQPIPPGYTEGQWRWIQALPAMIYEDSPFGRICTSKEFRCSRCLQTTKLELPQHFYDALDCEELFGDVMMNDFASQLGWIHKQVLLKVGREIVYVVCPDCILRDFETMQRVRALCSGKTAK